MRACSPIHISGYFIIIYVMGLIKPILTCLSDGKFHSGEKLANSLGVSRMAIWKQVRVLRNYGMDIFSVKRKGYRLAQPIELLDETNIRQSIDRELLAEVSRLQISVITDSTNRYLMEKLPKENIHGHIVLAEYQSAGRGSKGDRSWVSPFAAGIYMSMGWHFDTYPESFTALSLCAGVAVSRALARTGIKGISLKWPNDVIGLDRKLGGILIESRGITTGHCDVVLGTGINYQFPSHLRDTIDQPYTDLAGISRNLPSRNRLAGMIISELISMLNEYNLYGFGKFIQEWRELDHFAGKDAALIFSDKTLNGRVLGIDDNGMLSMSIDGKKKQFTSGELSLRSTG